MFLLPLTLALSSAFLVLRAAKPPAAGWFAVAAVMGWLVLLIWPGWFTQILVGASGLAVFIRCLTYDVESAAGVTPLRLSPKVDR